MPGIIASLALTKTLALICDIRKGRLSDVPAFSDIARGQAQNPKHNDFISSRLPQSVFFAENHVADCIFVFFAEHVADGIF